MITKFDKPVKREAVLLIDEVITTSVYDGHKPAKYAHEKLDNYGKNNWEYFKTHVQEKDGSVWELILNVTTKDTGEKVVYDYALLKKVEAAVTSATPLPSQKVTQSSNNVNITGHSSLCRKTI